jgi:hypothetical protein
LLAARGFRCAAAEFPAGLPPLVNSGFTKKALPPGSPPFPPRSLPARTLFFIDEMGFLELAGKGWGARLEELAAGEVPLVIVLRDYLLDRVCQRWGLARFVVWKAGGITAQAVSQRLRRYI